MRLTCPNCGAQYEVDPSVIPEEGRDVQCSNCGHTWFQRHPRDEAAAREARAPESPAETGSDAAHEAEAAAAPGDGAGAGAGESPAAAAAEAASGAEAAPGTGPALDEGVASILREEAEREQQARAREGGAAAGPAGAGEEGGGAAGPADAGEAGASDGAATAARERITTVAEAAVGGAAGAAAVAAVSIEEQVAHIAAETPAHADRRGRLPDIEEINSTLGGSEAEDVLGEDARAARGGGFRRGFILAVVLFAIAALIYALAPRIADAFPALTPALSAYVDWVNALRAGIDSLLLKAVDKITALVGQLGGGEG